eukprot:m.207246 g.207246  ORF g.207246 m.207246 type:complete len:773 (-) comp32977_c2_seq6:49-2367(-)
MAPPFPREFLRATMSVLALVTLLSQHAYAAACGPNQASLTLNLVDVYCDLTDGLFNGNSEFYVIAGVGDNEHTSPIVNANSGEFASFNNVVWDMGCVEYSLSALNLPYFMPIQVWEDDGAGISMDDLGYRGYVRIPKTESGSVRNQQLSDPVVSSERTRLSFGWAWSQIPTKSPTKPPTKSPTPPPMPTTPPTSSPPTRTPTHTPSKMPHRSTLPPTATPTTAPHIRNEFDNGISFTDNFTFYWSSTPYDDDEDDAQLSMALVCSGCDGYLGVATKQDSTFQYASAIIGVCVELNESVISIAQYSLRTNRINLDSSPVQPLTATSCSVVGGVTTLRFSRNTTSTDFNLKAGYIFGMVGVSEQIRMTGTKIAWVQSPTKAPTSSPSRRPLPAPTKLPSIAPTRVSPTFIDRNVPPTPAPTLTPSVDRQPSATTYPARTTTAFAIPSLISSPPSIVTTTNQACENYVDAVTQCEQFIYVFDQSCDALRLQCAKTCCQQEIDPTTASTPQRTSGTTIATEASTITSTPTSTSTSTSTVSSQTANQSNPQPQQAQDMVIVGGAVAAVVVCVIFSIVTVVCVVTRKHRKKSTQSQLQSRPKKTNFLKNPLYEQRNFKNPMFVPKSQATVGGVNTPANGVNENTYEHPVPLSNHNISSQDYRKSHQSGYEIPVDGSEPHYDEFTKFHENNNDDQAYGSLVGPHAVYGKSNTNTNAPDGQSYYASIANDSDVYATISSDDPPEYVDGYLDVDVAVGPVNANAGGRKMAEGFYDGMESFS